MAELWQPWVQRPIRMVVWGVAAFITFVCIVVNAGRRTNIVGSGKVDTTDVEPSDGPGAVALTRSLPFIWTHATITKYSTSRREITTASSLPLASSSKGKSLKDDDTLGLGRELGGRHDEEEDSRELTGPSVSPATLASQAAIHNT